MNRKPFALAASPALALSLVLSACASSGDYPSLARRDAERITGTAAPVEPEEATPVLPPPEADLIARIVQLVDQARQAHDRFQARRDRADRTISEAQGTDRASERWTEAQVALSHLVAARAPALVSLAELDQLYAAERLSVSETVSPAASALAEAREQVDGWVGQETAVIARLMTRLGN